MAKRRIVARSPVRNILEYAGKPIYLLLTFCVIVVLSVTHLFTHITHIRKRYKKRLHKQIHHPIKSTAKSRWREWHIKLPNRTFWLAFSITLIMISATFTGIYVTLLRDLPSPELLRDHPPALTTKILDRNGKLLYQIYRDENRSLIRLQDLPQYLIEATIASEDKNFYHHHGISPRGIFRAVIANSSSYYSCVVSQTKCSGSLQGGSTITQQLVKNALLSPEQTMSRKVKEVILALWTEQLYSKDEILEFYFNYVPYGGTAYGIEEASHQFFGKSAHDLSVPESALLAGLPVAPTILSPFGTRPYLAKNRQAQVLDAMGEMGYLTDGEVLAAKTESIVFKPQGINIKAPHFVMYVKDALVSEFGESMVSRGGLVVTTTLDLDKQQILEKEITMELAKLEKMNVGNGAGVITAPQTGEILAMVGSKNFFDTTHDGQVNVTIQERQPGSSIKPITYALAFMQGMSPTSLIDDAPICFSSPGSPNYCPSNYDKRFHGRVTARTALASSYNIPAIKLLNSLGISNMVNLARQMGISTWNDPSRFGLSLTLGGGEVTMLDMVEVYGVFANEGKRVPRVSIISVKDPTGRELYHQENTDHEEVVPAAVAYQISSILSDPVARAPAFGTHSVLNIPGHPVAVKTGTTNNLRDNWTFGYTPEILVATWVGNNDNSPMSSVASGITGASPIWSRTMQKILAGSKPIPFKPTERMVAVAICPIDSHAYCQDACPTKSRIEYFIPGTEPKRDCTTTGTIGDSAISISTAN